MEPAFYFAYDLKMTAKVITKYIDQGYIGTMS